MRPARATRGAFVAILLAATCLVVPAASHAGASLIRTPAGDVGVAEPVTFDASASTGSVREYRWDFGDGSQASGPLVTHAFRTDGAYLVRLTVRDASGSRSVAKSTVNAGAVYTDLLTQEVWIPSFDYTLHEILVRPNAPGRFPVIVEYGPYGPVSFSD